MQCSVHASLVLQEQVIEGSFAKVACKFSVVSETGTELTLVKGDTVQVVQTGAHATFNVKKFISDTCSHQEGWVPAYVIGMRGSDETQSK